MEQLQAQRRVALVTGGSRGIGREISLALASAGCDVVLTCARNLEAAQKVAAEIAELGVRSRAVCFDVSQAEQVEANVDQVIKEFGKVDILVNNAGIAVDGLLVRTKTADWEQTISTNLSSCFYTSRAVAKSMMKNRWGRIVNISSVIGESGNAGQAAYSASKSVLFGFSKSLAKELGSRGITVNVVAPGYIETDMTASISEADRAALLSTIALGKLGQAKDVADLVAFICSENAGYITGQVIGINGGMYM